jgi:hypothetical protein
LSTLDVDVSFGPGAAFGSDATNSTLDSNMGSCSSTIIASNISNVSVDNLDYDSLTDLLSAVETLTKDSLISLAQAHSITFPLKCTVTNLRGIISNHLSRGLCASSNASACIRIAENLSANLKNEEFDQTVVLSNLEILALSSVLQRIKLRPIRRILDSRNVSYSHTDSLSKLRKHLKSVIIGLKRGKKNADKVAARYALDAEYETNKEKIAKSWPQLVNTNLKDKIVKMFREQTSKVSLSSFTCASCAESALCTNCHAVLASDVDLNLLKFRQDFRLESGVNNLPLPYNHGPLQDVLLDPAGVTVDEKGNLQLLLCSQCHSALKQDKIPPLSLANGTFLGPIPDELKDLTVIEEAMIARCRAKCWIIQLKEVNPTIVAPDSQRGFRGHIIIYPQRPSEIAKLLPPNLTDIITTVCVLFVGSTPPSADWLREKAKPLCVRREKVRAALTWLKEHNPLYQDISINHRLLDDLQDSQVLPFHIEHVIPSDATEVLTSRYDDPQADQHPTSLHESDEMNHGSDSEDLNGLPFQNVVVTDATGHLPPHELRAAALRHVKQGGGYIQIPHDPTPVNEFFNPQLFPMTYPTLFPYGIGGFEDRQRRIPLSLKRHVKHLGNLADKRFQEHYSFLFTAFNILQRRSVLLHTSLKVRKSSFNDITAGFATVSPETIHIVTERISRGDLLTSNNPEEKKVLNLMKQIKTVTSNVPGSSASRVAMRNEIRGLMIEKGLPSFFITINPADIYNPVVKFLGGSDIDIDNLLPEQIPNYWEQAILVAKNPFVAAKFFNLYMKAFISSLLGYDPKQKNLEGGILGVVKAYYGCVEAQGRGTLHCHMMIWLEGALNPNEIRDKIIQEGDLDFRDRLISFLDDTISNAIPKDPDSNLTVPSSTHHPCSVRGINIGLNMSPEEQEQLRQKDLHHLVKCCQVHKHSKTCYKYWKGPPNPKECRFDLDENNICLETTFDMESGELCFRCLDGLVNNFNKTIIEAIRCNMDIKFIGSGPAAKAVIYYITNYITKSQLKTHVAYAALELAVKKLGDFRPDEDELTFRAKKLLQKCAFSMLSHQELSAQQVASYLMDYEDHFTSHLYRNLYWTSFEALINREQPSPECYQSLKSNEAETSESTAEGLDHCLDDLDQLVADHDECETESIIEDEPDESEATSTSNIENDNEEVSITVQTSGHLIAKATQVADYQLRDKKLGSLSVWDFISTLDKVPQSQQTRNRKNKCDAHASLSEDSELELESDHEFDEKLDSESSNINDLDPDTTIFQKNTTKKRTKEWFYFNSEHIESKTHCLSMRTHDRRFVLVPIGPSIPRRDQKEAYARYCRLMLIFFKPWRHASDLRSAGQKWEDAFELYMQNCPRDIMKKLDNMQILHECRDSGSDHFAERRNRRRQQYNHDIPSDSNRDNSDDFGGVDPSVILEHLESISSSNSDRLTRSQDTVNDCLLHAEMSGMFDGSLDRETQFNSNPTNEIHTYDLSLEEQWKTEYEKRRDEWKKKTVISESPNPSTQPENSTSHGQQYLDDGSAFRNALEGQPIDPTIAQDIPRTVTEKTIDIEAMIADFTLNAEQAQAFRIICEASLQKPAEPLKMYIGGAGGTGKSRVINALREFFIRRGQERRFRLASYTGVAAKNISGMTVHSALSLNQYKKGGANGKTHRDLIAMWEGVDFFFIDEISMIGCKMLYQISEALIEAKGNTSPFGGINLIVAGDFAQLPPVGESRLTASIDTSQTRQTSKRGQENVFGKLLWLSINKVVILKQSMRQTGPENVLFVDLLSRLREGRCTNEDYDLLSSRVLQNMMDIDWEKWKDTPIIVSENAQKDALNIRAAEAFARRTNQPLHWYHARDTHQRNMVTDPTLNAYLEKLNSGVTNQRLGKIPLVIGMPVMIAQNYDVESGIVNGCTGILKKIRYQKDAQGNRYATSCIVESSTITGAPLSTLDPHQAVVLQDTTNMTFRHPHSGKKCTIQRTQLPILPAFALTAHKAQGQTMEKVLVDLESCKGTESPYVMISRVTSLKGLLILRPFKSSKIQCRLSEDTRKEFRRLEKLRLHTIVETGTTEEKAAAQILLTSDNQNNLAANHGQRYSQKRPLTKKKSTNKSSGVNLLNSEQLSTDSHAPATRNDHDVEMTCVSHNTGNVSRFTKRRLTDIEPSTENDSRRKSRRLV